MLKSSIIHPELLKYLGQCGHKTKIMIADSNYSFVTNSSANARIVYLNFAPGMLKSTDVLSGICEMINIESATMCACPDDFDNTIIEEYKTILSNNVPFDFLERYTFYDAVKSNDTLLVIATGEQRRFANLLLTVGVVC
jgi:L-fucose mutarotase